MKGGPFTGDAFTLDPHPAAHHFAQPFADGQPQPRAAVAAGGGGVNLTKGAEKSIHPVRRNADAGITHGEMEYKGGGCFGFKHRLWLNICRFFAGYIQNHFTLIGKLDRITEQINQDLP